LPASPREVGRALGRHADFLGQRRLLPTADGGHARGHRARPVRGMGGGDEGTARRHRAGGGVAPSARLLIVRGHEARWWPASAVVERLLAPGAAIGVALTLMPTSFQALPSIA